MKKKIFRERYKPFTVDDINSKNNPKDESTEKVVKGTDTKTKKKTKKGEK